jgi:hypothetical protein
VIKATVICAAAVLTAFGFASPAHSTSVIPNSSLDGPYYVLHSAPLTTTNPCSDCYPINWGYSVFPFGSAYGPSDTRSVLGVANNSYGFAGNYFVLGPLGLYAEPPERVGFVTVTPMGEVPIAAGNYVLSFDVLNPIAPPPTDANYAPTIGVYAESDDGGFVNLTWDISDPTFIGEYKPVPVPYSDGLMHVSIPYASYIPYHKLASITLILGYNGAHQTDLFYQPGDTLFLGDISLQCVSDCRMVPQTPLPATLPLFATGLGVIGLFGWRGKRRAKAAAKAKG